MAYLYYVNQGELIPADTNIFYNEMGLYAFNNLLEGEYVVKVGLTGQSAHHADYFPVYYQQHLTWVDADPVVLNNAIFDAHIYLVPTVTMEPGPGNLGGYVSFQDGPPPSSPDRLNYIEVILYDEDEVPLTYTRTGPDGSFEFTGLPYGNYMVLAEEAGYFTVPVSFALNENHPLVDTLQLMLSYSPTFGIGEIEYAGLSVSDVYPNPASDHVNLDIELLEKSTLAVAVMDLTGRVHYSSRVSMASGQQRLRIPVTTLSRGIYLVSVGDISKSLKIIRKFVK